MGNALETVCGPVCYTRVNAIIIGLDFAGKTTILNRFAGKPTCQTPYKTTVGVNRISFTWSKLRVTALDFGGSSHSRPHWAKSYGSAEVVIFVIDSSDYKRFDEAKCEFCKAIKNKKFNKNALVLVYANKQDLPGALLPSQIEVRFGMKRLGKGKWKVMASNGYTCEGLYEGLSWIKSTLKGKATPNPKTPAKDVTEEENCTED